MDGIDDDNGRRHSSTVSPEERARRSQALLLLKQKMTRRPSRMRRPPSPEPSKECDGNAESEVATEAAVESLASLRRALASTEDSPTPRTARQPSPVISVVTARKEKSSRQSEERRVDNQREDELSIAVAKQKCHVVIKEAVPKKTESLAAPVSSGQAPTAAKSHVRQVVRWYCTVCSRECIPIREESRCLCGHRYKEHPSSRDDPRIKNKAAPFIAFACTTTKCPCKAFHYVVAEGAWILRCRCKHKHIDHDPGKAPFACNKPKCGCSAFDSPWVCNCDHPWASHEQEVVEKQVKPLHIFQQQFEVEELCQVQRTDLVNEPLCM